MLWATYGEVLTQAEFCRTLSISRTSLWRYVSGDREYVDVPAAVASRAARAEADEVWQEEARVLCERFMTYGYPCSWFDPGMLWGSTKYGDGWMKRGWRRAVQRKTRDGRQVGCHRR
jgi:hypothetical protein